MGQTPVPLAGRLRPSQVLFPMLRKRLHGAFSLKLSNAELGKEKAQKNLERLKPSTSY
jgi:hypothetical protein